MLILSRKEDESIVIGDNITIKIISIEKGLVKLGIDAPSEITILRSELLDAVEAANKEAAGEIDTSLLSDFHTKFKK